MWRFKSSILSVIAALLVLSIPTWAQQESSTVEASAGGRAYSLELPEGWERLELREEKEFSPAILRLGAPGGIARGAVYLQYFPKRAMTLDSYKTAARNYIEQKMEGQVISEREIPLNGVTSWQVQYQGNGPGFVDAQRRFLNTVLFDQDSIVVVHCAAQPELWVELSPAFEAISQSLKAMEGDGK
jgi:hypothetical protein